MSLERHDSVACASIATIMSHDGLLKEQVLEAGVGAHVDIAVAPLDAEGRG